MTGNTLRLRDGRTLAFAQYGDLSGRPVLFFHGMPGSRLQRHPDDTIAAGLGVRLVTVDRPGIGLSTFQKGRRLRDWADDVARLVDALRIERFAVAGWSGGGAYAVACAAGLPDRVTAAAIVAGFGPLETPGSLRAMTPRNRWGFRAARILPWGIVRRLWRIELRPAAIDPAQWYRRWLATVPAADRAVADAYPEVVSLLAQDLAEMLRAGTDGYAWDERVLARPWGVSFDAITCPLDIWHGSADALAPPVMARYLADRIKTSRLRVCSGEGHWLLFTHWREILADLRRS